MGSELVQKAVENFVNGTKNEWDNKVWKAVQMILLLRLPPDMAIVKLDSQLGVIQAEYDSMPPEKRWEMKKPMVAWSSDLAGRVVNV